MKNNRPGWICSGRSLACFAANTSRRNRQARACGDDCRCQSYHCSCPADESFHHSLAGSLPCRWWNDDVEYRCRIPLTKEECWWLRWIWIRAKVAGLSDVGSGWSSCRSSSCRTGRRRDGCSAAGRGNRWDTSKIRVAGHHDRPARDLAAGPYCLENSIRVSCRAFG